MYLPSMISVIYYVYSQQTPRRRDRPRTLAVYVTSCYFLYSYHEVIREEHFSISTWSGDVLKTFMLLVLHLLVIIFIFIIAVVVCAKHKSYTAIAIYSCAYL